MDSKIGLFPVLTPCVSRSVFRPYRVNHSSGHEAEAVSYFNPHAA